MVQATGLTDNTFSNFMYQILKEQGVLPLVTQIDSKTAEIILQSAEDAGIKAIEFAARAADAKEVFTHMVGFIAKNKLSIKLAVGSVLTVEDATFFHKAGADCIISPHTDIATGKYCMENNIYWIPGAATLNEVLLAVNAGAGLVKLFPADKIGGPGYVKAIRAPFPDLKLMPTGGVTLEESNLRAWFESGVVCVGIGSHLFSKEVLASLTYEKALAVFKQLLEIVRKSRN